MKKIIILIVIGFFLIPNYSQAQSQDKFHVYVKMSTSQSLADQKASIEFFREFFGTNNCSYVNSSNSYKIITIHNYNQVELKGKIENNSNYSDITITITKSSDPSNNNSSKQ